MLLASRFLSKKKSLEDSLLGHYTPQSWRVDRLCSNQGVVSPALIVNLAVWIYETQIGRQKIIDLIRWIFYVGVARHRHSIDALGNVVANLMLF